MAGDLQPWTVPGAVRRDCEPHRGHLLLWLANVGMACGVLSVLALPALPAVALGIAVEERDCSGGGAARK